MFEHGTAACPSRPALSHRKQFSRLSQLRIRRRAWIAEAAAEHRGTPWNTQHRIRQNHGMPAHFDHFWPLGLMKKYLWIALWIAMVYSDSEIWKVIWNRFGPLHVLDCFCTRVFGCQPALLLERDELGHHSRPSNSWLTPPDLGPWKHDTQTQSQLWQLSEEFRSIAPGERPWWAYTSIGAKLNQCWSNPQPTMLYCGDPRCRMIHRIGASGVKSSAERDHWGSNSSKGNCWAGSPGAVQYLAQHGMIRHVGYVGFFSMAVLSKKSKGHSGENWATGNSSTCLRHFSRFFCVKTLGPEAETQETQGVIFWAGGFIEITSSQYQLHDVMIYVIYNHIYICQS